MEFQEHKIDLQGYQINYVQAGVGPPMLFLHNGGGFWHIWEHQIRHFSKTHSVYGLDWPGYGGSDPADEPITLDLLTRVLRDFIDALGFDQVHLVGNCIGGSVALHYSQQYPERVARLVIFNICPGDLIYRFPPVRKFLAFAAPRPRLRKLASRLILFAFTQTPLQRLFPSILFGRRPHPEDLLALRYREKFREPKLRASRINLIFSVPTFNLDRYVAASPPDHVLAWGAWNRVTSLQNHGLVFRERLQPSRFVVVEGAGHLCMYEAAEQVNAVIDKAIE